MGRHDGYGRDYFHDGTGLEQYYACPRDGCDTPPVHGDSRYRADPDFCDVHQIAMTREVVPS